MAEEGKQFNKADLPDHQQAFVDLASAKIQEQIEKAEKGLPWQSPFATDMAGMPFNIATNQPFTGENIAIALMSGFVKPGFMTFKQMEAESKKLGKPLKLEKGSKATYFSKVLEVPKRDEQGNILKDEQGKPIPDTWPNGDKKLTRKWFAYFNESQIKGLEPSIKLNAGMEVGETVKTLANALMERDGLSVKHSGVGEAYYEPKKHEIHMPNVELFKSPEGYQQTFQHEAIHSTMKALERPIYKGIMEGKSLPWDSPERAKEELAAELGSVFLSVALGTPHSMQNHENSIPYMKSWLSVLKNEKNYLHVAAGQASKACQFVEGHYKAYVAEQELQKSIAESPKARMAMQVDRLYQIAASTGNNVGKEDAFVKKNLTAYIKQNGFTKDEVQDFVKENADMAKLVDMKKAFPSEETQAKTKKKELAPAL